jgi:hypothetical protein
MKKYQVKNESGVILAEVSVNDNQKITLEVIEDNSIIVDETFIRNNIYKRMGGPYKDKAVWLSKDFNWNLQKEILQDNYSHLLLIPTKK